MCALQLRRVRRSSSGACVMTDSGSWSSSSSSRSRMSRFGGEPSIAVAGNTAASVGGALVLVVVARGGVKRLMCLGRPLRHRGSGSLRVVNLPVLKLNGFAQVWFAAAMTGIHGMCELVVPSGALAIVCKEQECCKESDDEYAAHDNSNQRARAHRRGGRRRRLSV